jgi:ubiquinone/menaquinone biosynthesis C-methylase UbiE
MSVSHPPDVEQFFDNVFNKGASQYVKQSAGVTVLLSHQILPLYLPITTSSIIHDNACGPGIVTFDILAHAAEAGIPPPTIYATDFSQGMITELQRTIDQNGLKSVTAQVMDSYNLSPFGDDMFTHSITNLGIFAFPDPVAGARHILRTLKPGGVAVITAWKYPGNIYFANEVLQVVAPGSPEMLPLKDWLNEGHLRGIMEKAGFEMEKVEIIEKKVLWNLDDFEESVAIFDGPFWDLAKAGSSVEQKGRWKDAVRKVLKGTERALI